MTATAELQPVASGSLLETPFVHLTLYLYRHSQSGTLIVSGHEAGNATIRFERGRAAAALVPWPAPRMLDAVLPLCSMSSGVFAFFEGDLIGRSEDALAGIIDPYELLVASLDDHARDDMVDAVLKRFDGKQLRMQPGREIERLRLRPEHQPLVELIRAAPATSAELVAQAPLPPLAARRLLYALIATNMVASHEQREGDLFRSQVEPRTTNRPSNPALPTVEPRPNRPSNPALPTVEPPAGVASTPPRSNAAWQRLASLRPGSLSPSGMSLPPRNSMQPGPAPVSSVRPTSLAPEGDDKASRVKRIEQLIQRTRGEEALAELDAMIAQEPYDADLLALRAHVLFDKHQVNADGLPRTMLETLRRALEIEPEHPRALYVKGLVAKRAGDPKKAAVYFRKVLQVDPKHIEAERELRLAKLRDGT